MAGSKEALPQGRDGRERKSVAKRRLQRVRRRHNWVQSVLGAEKAPLVAEPSMLLLIYRKPPKTRAGSSLHT